MAAAAIVNAKPTSPLRSACVDAPDDLSTCEATGIAAVALNTRTP
jgi:hypothetical protein